ncbi:LacI family DNA-binding transcriptional regulator [Sphingobium aromaticiconvertens]|uniref:LacI family DNA-binding transcriptional regulator n=1 Tax=Sphingobium aromaticiconvertens TaxID=365341 RepID=UPI00301A9EA4
MHPPRKATSFDIAQLAGVSQPTVSRALRGHASISEETRKRIEAIAHQLNYKVDKNASSLRSQRSNTLALLFFEDPTPDGSHINPFFLSMVGSITRACARRGFDLLISFQQFSQDWHTEYEDSRKADGIILLGYGDYEQTRSKLELLVSQGTHFVLWGSSKDGQPGVTVGCDNRQGGEDATVHLMAGGRRRIAFIGTATRHYPEFFSRWRGYADAHEAAGRAIDPALHREALNFEEDGYGAAQTLLSAGAGFDAIMCASDTIALGAMRALQEAGRRIPQDVAVVGFDDIPTARVSSPPLSSVVQDQRLAGDVLVDTLVRQIEGGKASDTVLPVRLVVRQSSEG